MSDWWAKKLGVPQPPAQPQFYPGQQAPVYAPPVAPQAPPQQWALQPPQQPVAEPENLTQALQTTQYREIPRQAVETRKSSACPGCGGGNYTEQIGNARGHCHDCGYPLVQAGSGMGSLGGARGSGAARPAASPTYDPAYYKGT